MPVLQILSSTAVGDCLSDDDSGTTRQQLAVNLLGVLQEEGVKDKRELVKLQGFFLLLGQVGDVFNNFAALHLAAWERLYMYDLLCVIHCMETKTCIVHKTRLLVK